MAPRRRSHLPGQRATFIPNSFKCAIDGKWHEADQFSKNQIGRWTKKKFVDDDTTPENVGLICKTHAQKPHAEQEIRCHGPCGAYKHREQFSKAQRNEDEAWCTACVTWSINFAGDEAPNAAPGEVLQAHDMVAQTITIQDRIPIVADHDSVHGSVEELFGGSSLDDDDLGDLDGSVVEAAVTMMRSDPSEHEEVGHMDSSTWEGAVMDVADDISVATLTSHMASTPPSNFLGCDMLSRLYSYDAFTLDIPSGSSDSSSNHSDDTAVGDAEIAEDAIEDATTPEAAEPEATQPKVVRLAPIPSKKWFKPDTRKLFYAPQTYAPQPAENGKLRSPEDEESDDEDPDF
ncbi:hypothetical protein F5Y05DRAFT_414854 [Hypoxylon sp. FL0543]|nr:hypothetical protein F5Y05DRAFT_414854 [Hypoxylon sp. FL0543]